MDLEGLVQRALEELLSQSDKRDVSLTGLSRPLLEEIAALSDRDFDDFAVLLEAELILAQKRPKNLEDLATVRRAMRIRAARATPVREIFPELDVGADLVIPSSYVVSRNGIATADELVSTSPFFITGKVRDKDTGYAEYQITVFVDDSWQELRSPCARGDGGVARAVANAGVLVNPKAAGEYVIQWLIVNWPRLRITDAALEAAAAYERLVEMVAINIAKFLGEKWGKVVTFPEEPERVFVAITSGRFEHFLREIGRRDARAGILRAWKAQGLLRTDGEGRYTRRTRVGGAVLRCVVVELPPDFAAVTAGRPPVVTRKLLQIKEEKDL